MKFWLTLLLVMSLRRGGACDYLAFTMRQAATRADLIVRARVVVLRDSVHYNLYSDPIWPPFQRGYRPVLRIRRVLKGQWAPPELTLTTDETAGNACGPYFGVGQEYVIFLSRSRAGYTSSPSYPNFLTSDKQSLAAFRKLRAIARP